MPLPWVGHGVTAAAPRGGQEHVVLVVGDLQGRELSRTAVAPAAGLIDCRRRVTRLWGLARGPLSGRLKDKVDTAFRLPVWHTARHVAHVPVLKPGFVFLVCHDL